MDGKQINIYKGLMERMVMEKNHSNPPRKKENERKGKRTKTDTDGK